MYKLTDTYRCGSFYRTDHDPPGFDGLLFSGDPSAFYVLPRLITSHLTHKES